MLHRRAPSWSTQPASTAPAATAKGRARAPRSVRRNQGERCDAERDRRCVGCYDVAFEGYGGAITSNAPACDPAGGDVEPPASARMGAATPAEREHSEPGAGSLRSTKSNGSANSVQDRVEIRRLARRSRCRALDRGAWRPDARAVDAPRGARPDHPRGDGALPARGRLERRGDPRDDRGRRDRPPRPAARRGRPGRLRSSASSGTIRSRTPSPAPGTTWSTTGSASNSWSGRSNPSTTKARGSSARPRCPRPSARIRTIGPVRARTGGRSIAPCATASSATGISSWPSCSSDCACCPSSRGSRASTTFAYWSTRFGDWYRRRGWSAGSARSSTPRPSPRR